MKIRVMVLVWILVLALAVLMSCTPSGADTRNPFDNRFVDCYVNSNMRVIVDKVTGICYLSYSDYQGLTRVGNGITVLLNVDGTPLTYTEACYAAE